MEMYNEYNPDLKDKIPDIYILSMGQRANQKAFELSEKLRLEGYIVEKDIMERSFKSQMKYADKIMAKKLLVIGDNELDTNRAKIKNMQTGEEIDVDLELESIKNLL